MDKNMGIDFGLAFSCLYRKNLANLGKALKKFNLSAGELPFFMHLRWFDGATAGELSSLLHIDKATTARAVKSLENKGLIKRVRGVEDKRENKLFLTESAKRLFVEIDKTVRERNELMMKDIAELDLDIAYSVLSKMLENIGASVNFDRTVLKNRLVDYC
ncbi:MAG: MarR family transcriptional regulator [Treponema sp.]|jgi:DNA-binding MarR family transcriptional regulator|nr:MarR family transcriptional regulator [Treponema sp.]